MCSGLHNVCYYLYDCLVYFCILYYQDDILQILYSLVSSLHKQHHHHHHLYYLDSYNIQEFNVVRGQEEAAM
jgi:hypothetical protein